MVSKGTSKGGTVKDLDSERFRGEVAALLASSPATALPQLCDSLLVNYLGETDGSQSPREHLMQLSNATAQRVCPHVFSAGDTFWNCRDCQVGDDTCVICNQCYLDGSHEGHDVRFHIVSGENGGTCDCGDTDAWKASGFCSRHGNHDTDPLNGLPPALMDRTNTVVGLVLDFVVKTVIMLVAGYCKHDESIEAPLIGPAAAAASVAGQALAAVEEMGLHKQFECKQSQPVDPPSVTLEAEGTALKPLNASWHFTDSTNTEEAGAAKITFGKSPTSATSYSAIMLFDDIHSIEQRVEAMAQRVSGGQWHSREMDLRNLALRCHEDGSSVVMNGNFDETKEIASQMQRVGILVALVGNNMKDRLHKSEVLIRWLHSLSRLGDGFARLIGDALVKGQLFGADVIANDIHTPSSTTHFTSQLQVLIECDALQGRGLQEGLHQLYMLLIGDTKFKTEFACAFGNSYQSLAWQFSQGLGLAMNSVFNLTVQFLNRTSVVQMLADAGLLEVILTSLGDMLLAASAPTDTTNSVKFSTPMANHMVLAHKRYMPLLLDLRYMLTIPEMATHLVVNTASLRAWFNVLALLQCIQPLERKMGSHIEREDPSWLSTFNLLICLGNNFPLATRFLSHNPVVGTDICTTPGDEFNTDEDVAVKDSAKRGRLKLLNIVLSCGFETLLQWARSIGSEGEEPGCYEAAQNRPKMRFVVSMLPLPLGLRSTSVLSFSCLIRQTDAGNATHTSSITPEDEVLPQKQRTRVPMPGPSATVDMVSGHEDGDDDDLDAAIFAPAAIPHQVAFHTPPPNSSQIHNVDLHYLKAPWISPGYSFHLPIHRFLALLVQDSHMLLPCHSIASAPAARVWDTVLPRYGSAERLRLLLILMELPLRTLSLYAQIQVGMWRRNGGMLSDQAMNYACSQPPLCKMMRDLDLSVVQWCAVFLPPSQVVALLMRHFQIGEWILCPPADDCVAADNNSSGKNSSDGVGLSSFNPLRCQLTGPTQNVVLKSEFELPLAEHMLSLLIVIVTELPRPPRKKISSMPAVNPAHAFDTPLGDATARPRAHPHIGVSSYAQDLRREVVHLLAVSDRPHSELAQCCQRTKHSLQNQDTHDKDGSDSSGTKVPDAQLQELAMEAVLKSVAKRLAPRGMEPGRWSLRWECWSEYDPEFYHLSRVDHAKAQERQRQERQRREQQLNIQHHQLMHAQTDSESVATPRPYIGSIPSRHVAWASTRKMLFHSGTVALIHGALLGAVQKNLLLQRHQDQVQQGERQANASNAPVSVRQPTSDLLVARALHLLTLQMLALEEEFVGVQEASSEDNEEKKVDTDDLHSFFASLCAERCSQSWGTASTASTASTADGFNANMCSVVELVMQLAIPYFTLQQERLKEQQTPKLRQQAQQYLRAESVLQLPAEAEPAAFLQLEYEKRSWRCRKLLRRVCDGSDVQSATVGVCQSNERHSVGNAESSCKNRTSMCSNALDANRSKIEAAESNDHSPRSAQADSASTADARKLRLARKRKAQQEAMKKMREKQKEAMKALGMSDSDSDSDGNMQDTFASSQGTFDVSSAKRKAGKESERLKTGDEIVNVNFTGSNTAPSQGGGDTEKGRGEAVHCQPLPLCIMCQESSSKCTDRDISMNGTLAYIGLCTQGDIMQWGFGGVADASAIGSNSGASADDTADRRNQSMNHPSNPFSNFDNYAMQNGPHHFYKPSVGVHLRTCGHVIHYSCCDAYLASCSKSTTQGPMIVDAQKGEFLCPLCKTLSNVLLPHHTVPIVPMTRTLLQVQKQVGRNGPTKLVSMTQHLHAEGELEKTTSAVSCHPCHPDAYLRLAREIEMAWHGHMSRGGEDAPNAHTATVEEQPLLQAYDSGESDTSDHDSTTNGSGVSKFSSSVSSYHFCPSLSATAPAKPSPVVVLLTLASSVAYTIASTVIAAQFLQQPSLSRLVDDYSTKAEPGSTSRRTATSLLDENLPTHTKLFALLRGCLQYAQKFTTSIFTTNGTTSVSILGALHQLLSRGRVRREHLQHLGLPECESGNSLLPIVTGTRLLSVPLLQADLTMLLAVLLCTLPHPLSTDAATIFCPVVVLQEVYIAHLLQILLASSEPSAVREHDVSLPTSDLESLRTLVSVCVKTGAVASQTDKINCQVEPSALLSHTTLFLNTAVVFMRAAGIPLSAPLQNGLPFTHQTELQHAEHAASMYSADDKPSADCSSVWEQAHKILGLPKLSDVVQLVEESMSTQKSGTGETNFDKNSAKMAVRQWCVHAWSARTSVGAQVNKYGQSNTGICSSLKGATSIHNLYATQSRVPWIMSALPHSFTSLSSQLAGATCGFCGEHPEEIALCLLCGEVLCAGSRDCRLRSVGACTRHVRQANVCAMSRRSKFDRTKTSVGAGPSYSDSDGDHNHRPLKRPLNADDRECGGLGVGVFLLVQRCAVLLISGSKAAYFPSLYVDSHGEDDPGLRRGRPLYLSEGRLESLQQLYLTHGVAKEITHIQQISEQIIRDNYY